MRENMRMVHKAQPRHFLRAWRKHRGLSIEAAIAKAVALAQDRVVAEGEETDLKRLGLSQPNISRIERGEIPYNETIMELLAEVYETDVPSLIIRDPADPEGLWSIYDQIEPAQRTVALRMLSGLKTGTG
jgi:transcriptional regulator with XRE-family HTH domain